MGTENFNEESEAPFSVKALMDEYENKVSEFHLEFNQTDEGMSTKARIQNIDLHSLLKGISATIADLAFQKDIPDEEVVKMLVVGFADRMAYHMEKDMKDRFDDEDD